MWFKEILSWLNDFRYRIYRFWLIFSTSRSSNSLIRTAFGSCEVSFESLDIWLHIKKYISDGTINWRKLGALEADHTSTFPLKLNFQYQKVIFMPYDSEQYCRSTLYLFKNVNRLEKYWAWVELYWFKCVYGAFLTLNAPQSFYRSSFIIPFDKFGIKTCVNMSAII